MNILSISGSIDTIVTAIKSNGLYYSAVLILILLVALKLVNVIFDRFRMTNNDSIVTSFAKNCIQALLIITVIIRIGSLSPVLSAFASQILMSSSLIVVVLGFIFQEGLSNIVHGFILMIFKPFKIGDRVKITIDGESITGYVRLIDLRSTIIENALNSSSVIIPNSKMDLCVIDNSYFDHEAVYTDFIYLTLTYESDLDRACRLLSETTANHPLVRAARQAHGLTDPVSVMITDFEDSGVVLRVSVVTDSVEENFKARCDIRKEIWQIFSNEPSVDFAYPHIQMVPGESSC